MKLIKSFLAVILFAICLPMAGQAPTFDELEFEPDSIKAAYKPVGKNYVFVRSKRGTNGLNKTASADAILSSEVSEIILVFSEIDASDITEREEANRERWENLLKTYPEFFQFSTTYKNVCQCNARGDSAAFKHSQGFYIYVNGDVPKVAAEPVAASTPPPARTEEKKPAASAPPATPATAMKAAKEEDKKVATPDVTAVKVKEPPVVETPANKAPAREAEAVAATRVQEEAPAEETAKEPVRKKPAVSSKPRKARDPKACRPPCYGSGDEELYTFFKDNITLSKKEKRKAKGWIANVRLQINFDGSVKKVMVTGADPEVNKRVEDAIKAMNNWNAAVKSGVAVKSEVRFTMKFDKESKSMKPFDFVINPRPSPKCQCQSDSEIFAD